MYKPTKYCRSVLLKECTFETSRSGGKGGQHVNKTETKVSLIFDVDASKVLGYHQKERLLTALHNRVSEGKLRMSAETHRSQHQNKSEVIKRFFELLDNALKEPKKRVPTKIPEVQKEIRMKNKRAHKEIKNMRRKIRKENFD